MTRSKNNLAPLERLFFAETISQAHEALIAAGAKHPLKCRIISEQGSKGEYDDPFYFCITDDGLDVVWCGAVAEFMVHHDDGMSDSLIIEWLADRRVLDALEVHSLASGFTPSLIALVNAPPRSEAELRSAWTMIMDVTRDASGQQCFSPDEMDEQWSRVLGSLKGTVNLAAGRVARWG